MKQLRKNFIQLFLVKIIIFSLVFTGFIFFAYTQVQTITLQSLVENPEKYDQKTVSFQAELIGEPLKTETGVWLNVGANDYNMGVFLAEKEVLKKVNYWGSYQEKGDIVAIEGIFYKNCPIHHQREIHLKGLNVIEQGQKVEHEISKEKRKFALISFIICLTIGIIYFIKVKLWQKK